MSEYVLAGECNRCGDCCRWVQFWFPDSGDAAHDADYRRWLALHDRVSLTEDAGGYEVELPLRCGQLFEDPAGGRTRCMIYERRPQLCRDWPFGPRDLISLPRCSLRFELRPAG